MAPVSFIKTAGKNSAVKFDRAKSASESYFSARRTKIERLAEKEEKFDRNSSLFSLNDRRGRHKPCNKFLTT